MLKALAFVPPIAMLPSVTGTVPVLLSVTVCGVLADPAVISGKLSELALRLTVGTAAEPVNATVAEPPVLALFAIDSVAVSVAVVVEAKLTVTVQVAETASDAPQVVVSLKALAYAPLIAMLPSVTGTVPELVSVRICGVLPEPATISGKLSELALCVSCVRVATPVSATVTVPLVVESVEIVSVAL